VTIMVVMFLIGIPTLACVDLSTAVGCDWKIILFPNYKVIQTMYSSIVDWTQSNLNYIWYDSKKMHQIHW